MRDAIGGVVSIQLILVFIAVVSGYLAFSVSYTKAVHVKDFIINKIEEYEASPEDKEEVANSIADYMKSIGYSGVPDANVNANEICTGLAVGEASLVDVDDNNSKDYVVCKFQGGDAPGIDKEGKRFYYGVSTYITIDIPIIKNLMMAFPFFKISGKTRLIEEH